MALLHLAALLSYELFRFGLLYQQAEDIEICSKDQAQTNGCLLLGAAIYRVFARILA
jgi:hypothetical protein